MISPRWRKVLLDLWGNKVRTFLVVISISIGVFAVGFINSALTLLLNDMNTDYQSANPHGAILSTQPFTDDLLGSLKKVPGVSEVEGRSMISTRLYSQTEKKVAVDVIAITDVNKMKIDLIRSVDGGSLLPLKDHEILIEQASLAALAVNVGDLLPLELPGGRIRSLRVAGIVHDVTSIAYTFSGQATVFVNPKTLEWMEGPQGYNQLYLTVAQNPTDEKYVSSVAQAVADKIERSGRDVYYTSVNKPGRHFASDIAQALGGMMTYLGVLAVFLSGFLVINTINSLLNQHIRQIGVMKAIGGDTTQIMAMYLVLVLVFGLAALVLALPSSLYLSWVTASELGKFLNFKPGPFRILPQTVLIQTSIALALPVLAALAPVLNGTRITIREAISTYGLSKGRFGKHGLDKVLEKINFLPRPLLISLRNSVRRKARLALTLLTLTLGGAIFMGVFNNEASLKLAIQEAVGYSLSDVNVTLTRPERLDKLVRWVQDIPGVAGVEGWAMFAGQVLSADKTTATEIYLVAPPATSTLIKPVLLSGRWLIPADENAIVIGNSILKDRPDLKTGDDIVLKIEGKEHTWHIVGIYKAIGGGTPLVYTFYGTLARIVNFNGMVSSLRIITSSHTADTQNQVAGAIERVSKQAGNIQIGDIITGTEYTTRENDSTRILIIVLLIMAMLIALVGGLGLMGTMSMNILERTREIGVMRTIGASDADILMLVIVEGMLIGLISWFLALILAQPITLLLNTIVGTSILSSPLSYTFSWPGLILWLVGVLSISALASALPAHNASRLTIREVLAYE